MNTILLSLAILPVIVLAFFVYRQDKFEKEPLGKLLKAFFFGCLSTGIAVMLETMLSLAFVSAGGESWPGVLRGAFNGYVVAGSSEELCKLLMLMLAVWRSREFNEYFDGIVYATFVSLGFAGVENVMYVFGQETFSSAVMTGSVRAVLSVPGHFLFGVAMGYYFALAKFQPEQRWRHLLMAFLVPMLLHGTFDALLMIPEAMGEEYTWISGVLFPLFIYFDVKLWKTGMRKLRHLQELSGEQQDEGWSDSGDGGGGYGDTGWGESAGAGQSQDPFSGFNWNP